ncbi:MAG: DUF5058 family protein [Hungatella sp.]
MITQSMIMNGLPMILLCSLAILIVVIQPLIFLKIAVKRGKELGIKTDEMKSCAKGSAIFSVIPSIPIIISYLLLVPALGRFFPWLRLSVVGSAPYETMVADMAAISMGYPSIFGVEIDPPSLIAILMIITVGIIGGAIFILIFLKGYDKKVREIKTKNALAVPIITTAMFLALYGTMAAPHIANFKNPLSLVSIITAGIASMACIKLSAKHKKFKEFAFSISIICGMLAACIVNAMIV